MNGEDNRCTWCYTPVERWSLDQLCRHSVTGFHHRNDDQKALEGLIIKGQINKRKDALLDAMNIVINLNKENCIGFGCHKRSCRILLNVFDSLYEQETQITHGKRPTK
jgi:hypothetical protein